MATREWTPEARRRAIARKEFHSAARRGELTVELVDESGSDPVRSKIAYEVAQTAFRVETGGRLLGWSDDPLRVWFATGPGHGATHEPYAVNLGRPDDTGILDLVGDWHTHDAEGSEPSAPSPDDMNGWAWEAASTPLGVYLGLIVTPDPEEGVACPVFHAYLTVAGTEPGGSTCFALGKV